MTGSSVSLAFILLINLCQFLEAINPESSHLISENDQIIADTAKASESSSSSPGFAQGIWGAFVFILIGLIVFVTAMILLLRFVLDKPNDNIGNSQSVSTQELMNDPSNTAGAPEPRFKPRNHMASVIDDKFYDNQANDFVESPSPTSYNNYNDDFYPPQFQSYPPPEQNPMGYEDNYNQNSAVPPYNSNNMQQPSYMEEYQDTSLYPTVAPLYSEEKEKSADSEQPYQFLDKYEPLTGDKETVQTKTKAHLKELSTKRAVLRSSTPYQVIEDRVQGEDYDDTDSFIPMTPGQHALRPSPSRLSSDSFNDGKTRMLRVLPRFHQGVGDQQAGAPSPPVFVPVAPPQLPPESNVYSIPPKYY